MSDSVIGWFHLLCDATGDVCVDAELLLWPAHTLSRRHRKNA